MNLFQQNSSAHEASMVLYASITSSRNLYGNLGRKQEETCYWMTSIKESEDSRPRPLTRTCKLRLPPYVTRLLTYLETKMMSVLNTEHGGSEGGVFETSCAACAICYATTARRFSQLLQDNNTMTGALEAWSGVTLLSPRVSMRHARVQTPLSMFPSRCS